ncbi:MAG: DUF4080 domain-containing protein [Treponema sp.]|nr:DUF4080 domain-containing protein [Treponema sp.]
MDFLLVGVNASYMHTCLGVRSLSAYCDIPFVEFTINQPVGEILRGIASRKPDVVLFSTYIWNAEIICKIIPDVKKIIPGAIIGAGGPEFGFAAKKYLSSLSDLDFIMSGEGEEVLNKLKNKNEKLKIDDEENKREFFEGLKEIKGIWFRKRNNEITFTGEQELICDLGILKFPYPFLKNEDCEKNPELNHKIYYYESSRGCPYKCSYCLSSTDTRVRFMPLQRVYQDLQIFLDAKVPLVKFVDRTYNLNPDRYISIWKYIVEHHNKITMFHFEIEAEYLSKEALEFLQSVPEGVMQFEIGVQSANKKTLKTINRSDNIEKLAENIKQIPRTIHQHLDLIAGLPYEDLESFGKSFDFVISLNPDALQLGFLKVLSGTVMEKYAKENGWKWMENPVYETFSTPFMPYEHMLFLKDLEIVLDAYWNSGKFKNTMAYVQRNMSLWDFFYKMTELGQKQGVFEVQRRETFWFEYLANNCEKSSPLYDLLRYDFIIRGKQGNFPQWYEHRYDKNRHRELLEENGGVTNARLDFAHSEYEIFNWDVTAKEPENTPGTFEKLIRYGVRG